MLENQLLLAVVFKQHGILVERAYFACEFNSADQVYRDRSLIFADRIKKRVLNVLCRLIVHVPISQFLLWSNCVIENAQALAATAKLDSEPERTQVLLKKVYTPSGLAPRARKSVAPKTVQRRQFDVRRWLLGCTPGASGCVVGDANITNVGDRKESPDAPPVRVPSLDLSREYRAIGPLLLRAAESVFSAQNFIMGAQVAEFERAAGEKCGVPHAIGCSSGTDALWLALQGAGIGPGDTVVTTAFSFFATVSAILRAGAQPLLADIDPETFNLDPGAAKACLRAAPGVRAILPVHLYGQTADWDCFELLKREHNLVLIEDAAQAFGASWDGRKAGALGDAAAFSFYPTKNLSAAGEAGMVTTGSETIAERVRLLRVHGMHRRYYHDEVGWNSRLDTLQAAVLLVKLGFVDSWNAERQRLAENYRALFMRAGLMEPGPYPQNGVVLPTTKSRATHVFHQFVIRARRRDAMKTFLRDQGVGSEIYYPLALHQQPALRSLGYAAGAFPESERAAAEVLALPLFPQLTFEEQEIVVGAIADFLS
jgi:dTDP-4-amino-4,6-dideoxygalactose transaminase